MRISKSACSTSTSVRVTPAVSNDSSVAMCALSSSMLAVPVNMRLLTCLERIGFTELRHDLAREEPHRIEHLLLRDHLESVEQEVDARQPERLPTLERGDDDVGITDADALGDPVGLAGTTGLAVSSRCQVAERLVGACRERLARPHQVRV